MRFMMGEAVRQCKKVQQRGTVLGLLQLLDTPPREVAGLQHLGLLLQMVNEWLCLVGSQGRSVLKTLERVQAEHHLSERFVAWLHAAIRLVRVDDYGYVDDKASARALEAVCSVARRADRCLSRLGSALAPTWSGIATCESSPLRRGGVYAMGQLAVSCATLAPVLLPHLAQALVGDGDSWVRNNAATAMGQVVAAAPGLAAEALAHLAQALVGDGDEDVR